MNGIEKITARIMAEAESDAAAIRAEAEKSAAAQQEELAKKAEAEYNARLLSGTDEIQQQVQRLDRSARLEAKMRLLGVKQDMLAAAYAAAKEKLLSLPEEEYVSFLAKLAGNAARSGDELVILSASDRERVGDKVIESANALLAARGLPAKLSLGDSREIDGGLVLKKGSIEVNCAVDSLLELSHSRMDAEVAGILFRA